MYSFRGNKYIFDLQNCSSLSGRRFDQTTQMGGDFYDIGFRVNVYFSVCFGKIIGRKTLLYNQIF